MQTSKFKVYRSYAVYFVPILNIFQCISILHQKGSSGEANMSLLSFSISFITAFIAIGLSLRRFMKILRKPYEKQNLYIVISVIFSVITFYAVIYCLIMVFEPNSFSGMEGGTLLESVVNTIYFSIVTFTTVGYGDIHPTASLSKIVVSVEIMSFFIFFVLLASNHNIFFKPEESE